MSFQMTEPDGVFTLDQPSGAFHCYLSLQRFHVCFETFHSRLLSRWAALFHCMVCQPTRCVQGSGFRVQGAGCRVQRGCGFRGNSGNEYLSVFDTEVSYSPACSIQTCHIRSYRRAIFA